MSITVEKKKSKKIADSISNLLAISRENESKIWRDMAERLVNGRRRYASINVNKINDLANDGDVIVVPGYVLGTGEINKKVTVGALKFSKEASEKLLKSGSSIMDIAELARNNPKGTNVKIMR
ncbi:MAG: 50S ribosomal protein L18e [Thermoplasmata archaeon]